MGQRSNAMLGFKSFEKEYFSKVYKVLDEIPEYGGHYTWPLVIAIIGPKACLDLQISVCDKQKSPAQNRVLVFDRAKPHKGHLLLVKQII